MLKGQHAKANTPFTLERHQQIRIGKVLKESHLLMPIGLDGDIGGNILFTKRCT